MQNQPDSPASDHPSQITDSRSPIPDHRSGVASYVLVTPAYNEEALIYKTIESVIAQSHKPAEWIIVSDRSSDRTDEIVKEYAKQHPWLKLLRIEDNEEKGFARVVTNTETGIRSLSCKNYQYLGLLDADVTFQSDYFERLKSKFEESPQLGLAGGVVIDIGTPRDVFPRNKQEVPGAVQFFRRSCFESIGGLIPIPEGGWDGMTAAMARMSGFETRLCTDLVVDHHKPRNISQGGALRRKYQMGTRDYAAGYHPFFEVVKCSSRVLRERPYFLASLAWFYGYLVAALKRNTRIVPEDVVNYIRQEQLRRLFGSRTSN
ncbi:glycosyltransferase [Pelagicoccus mobilis]|uniref:Glycosyltransferase family 2 protein n=1 Tax=Pelagicoccus mobilis TaxID=415221 RepID=A0A934RS75_9BACT|nr:glycosyltransferase family A protein [Pelagicoccus mobilis]MBK1876625.1 glycosyltransferase family 2 protein [Pelagicoccus mobilis]